MDRAALSAALAAYVPDGDAESASLTRLRAFVAGPEDPFYRATPEGHVTGSAVVARPDGSAFLLVLHRKLSRWLQPGGHTEEADASVFDTALREAREETGLSQLSVVRKLGEIIYDISPYRYEIQHRHVFQLQVHEPTGQRWPSQELHDGHQPPTRLECFWIPLRNAHILQAGQGALIGAIIDE